MRQEHIKAILEGIVPVLRDAIATAQKPLLARIDALEQLSPEKGEPGAPGRDGQDGKSVTAEDVAPLLEELVSKAVSAIPVPKDGEPGPAGRDGADGQDGKSVTAEDVAELIEAAVERRVALIPVPKDGEPGAPGKSVTAEDVAPLLEELVSKAVSAIPVPKDGEPGPAGRDGADGQDGKSVTAEDVAPLLEELVSKAVSAIPVAKDGEPGPAGRDGAAGQDGKSVTAEDVAPLLEELVSKAVSALPPARDGVSVTAEDVRPMVAELVETAVTERVPKSQFIDGDGVLNAVYADGEIKPVGKVRGEDGARGASIMDGHVNEDGVLVLRMSDGRILQTGRVKGDDGRPGDPGRDGARGRDALEIQVAPSVDETKSYPEGVCARWRGGVIRSDRQTDPIVNGDVLAAGWSVLQEGIAEETEQLSEDGRYIERTTTYSSGREYVRRVKLETPIDRGVWKEGVRYEKGDGVTWAGSWFVAQRDTTDKPETSDAFRLAVKRGRDGKDGKLLAERQTTVVKI